MSPTARKERYAGVPLRVHDALEADELSIEEFAVLCWMEGRANHRKAPPQITATLITIREAVRWTKSDDSLSRALRKLQDGGWIDFNVRQGQRSPYVITLTGLLRRAEVTSAARKSENAETPHGDSEGQHVSTSAAPNPQLQPQETATETTAEAGKRTAFINDGESHDLEPLDALSDLVAAVRDRDDRTKRTFEKHFGPLLPAAAFRTALESLELRRLRKPPLDSEAKYVFSTLRDMAVSGQYARAA